MAKDQVDIGDEHARDALDDGASQAPLPLVDFKNCSIYSVLSAND